MDNKKSSYIINTDRAKEVNDALSISLLDAGFPSLEAMDLAELYIEGKIEVDEIRNKIIDMYTKR